MKRLISVLGLDIGFTSVKQLELSDLAIEYKVNSYRVEPLPEKFR